MKIFIDARWIRTDFHDGISRYTAGVVSGFKTAKIPITILIHDKKQLEMLPDGIPYEIVNYPVSFKEFLLPRKLNKMGADVVFSPLQVMGYWGRKYKLILTLQDIIYYRFPEPPTNLPQWIRVVWRLFHSVYWPQRWLLNHADYVGTVSHGSKKYITDMHLTDREIVVVYNASSLDLSGVKPAKKRTKNIIYMGSFMPYKNVEVLIRGLEHLPKDYTLHLLSKVKPERKSELEKIIPKDANVIFHNGVSDEKYIELLTDAACLATGSKIEGFGLPIVEAQTLGTPVILNNDLDILHEVAEDAALYFSADDDKEFAKCVLALENKETFDDLVKKGYAQAKKFAWESSAKELYKVCQELVKK